MAMPNKMIRVAKFGLLDDLSNPSEVYFYELESPQEWNKHYLPFRSGRTRTKKYTSKWPEYFYDYKYPKRYYRFSAKPKQQLYQGSHDSHQFSLAKSQWMEKSRIKFQFFDALYDAIENEIARTIVQGLIALVRGIHASSE